MSENNASLPADPRWRLDVVDLVDAVGMSRTITEDRPAPGGLGVPLAEIPADSPIHMDLRLDAVHEGLVLSGQVSGEFVGECSRCLNPLTATVSASLNELYEYEPVPDVDPEEQRLIVHGGIDLELPVRNGLMDGIPFQPVCSPDCLGLCDQCGVRLEDVGPDHAHEQLDPRWAALEAFASARQPASDATIDTQTSTPDPKER